jgi:hypothetical protein
MFPSSMRSALSCLLFLTALLAHAGEAEFVRVWPGWRDAESFDRIGEYFGRGEGDSGGIVVRTQPDARAGYYFLVRVKSAQALTGARFELSIVRPDSPETKPFTFPAALRSGDTVFQLGLTGAAWPGGKKASPVAWKLALVASDGRLLAEQKSFLWEKPAK